MKKTILILSFFLSNLLSSDINSKLYEKILEGLFPHKDSILIYNIGENKYNFNKIAYTKEIYNSDIILVSEYYRLDIFTNRPLFVSDLRQLKIYENSIGALYWENDEAKIIFLKNRLERYNIKIADYLKKYVVDEKIYSF